jgi:predicted HicB family RNase H-like nuclease
MVYNKPKDMRKNKTSHSSRVTLRLPLSLARKIIWLAAKANLSLNQTVENLLIHALSQSTSKQVQATRQSPDSGNDD